MIYILKKYRPNQLCISLKNSFTPRFYSSPTRLIFNNKTIISTFNENKTLMLNLFGCAFLRSALINATATAFVRESFLLSRNSFTAKTSNCAKLNSTKPTGSSPDRAKRDQPENRAKRDHAADLARPDYAKFSTQQPKDVRLLLSDALKEMRPLVEVNKIRIRGRTQFVPKPIYRSRQINITLRWIKQEMDKRKKNTKFNAEDFLACEILNGFYKKGEIRKKRNLLHKLAEENRALIRAKWW